MGVVMSSGVSRLRRLRPPFLASAGFGQAAVARAAVDCETVDTVKDDGGTRGS